MLATQMRGPLPYLAQWYLGALQAMAKVLAYDLEPIPAIQLCDLQQLPTMCYDIVSLWKRT